LIQVENLTKRYAATTAVDGVSFRVEKHEILGFLGPNGAGKSSTLRVLTCFHPPTAGRVTVDGHDVVHQPAEVKRRIGYLPENVPLYPELRVHEYLRYRAALKGVPGSRRRKAVDEAMERCGVTDVRRRIVGQLSKGYRQRVGLADALVGDPQILVLDEPTIGLDPNQIRQVRGLIRELGRERTVILSSHILPEVEAVCSRVLIVNRGRLVGQGRPEELRSGLAGGRTVLAAEIRDPAGNAVAALRDVPGVLAVGSPVPGEDGLLALELEVEPGAGVREGIFDAAVAGGFKLLGLASRTATLEDIFVRITTREDGEEPGPAPTPGVEEVPR
jgi:ABC-2 type transport system ATP-binding protein